MYAIVSGVATLAVLLALVLLFSVIIATVSVVAITLNVPNEIRGLALGAMCSQRGCLAAPSRPRLLAS